MDKTLRPEPEALTKPTRARRPNRPRPHDTQPSPRDARTWLARAKEADTLEYGLLCLNRALAIDPSYPRARHKMEKTLQHLLSHDAFLQYVGENTSLYQVKTQTNLILQIPKHRVAPKPYPPPTPSPLKPAFRWLGLSVLGLPVAGLGALIALPVVLIYAIRAQRQSLSRADQIRITVLLMIALILTGFALILALLFILHV